MRNEVIDEVVKSTKICLISQNLKRLLQKRGWGRRPLPAQAAALVPSASGEADTFPKKPYPEKPES